MTVNLEAAAVLRARTAGSRSSRAAAAIGVAAMEHRLSARSSLQAAMRPDRTPSLVSPKLSKVCARSL
jgi:hypothetical protein